MTMSLTNNGILPAVARIMMESHPCFHLAPGPQLVTLASKQSHRLTVDFDAVEVKQYAHEVGAVAVFASIQAEMVSTWHIPARPCIIVFHSCDDLCPCRCTRLSLHQLSFELLHVIVSGGD